MQGTALRIYLSESDQIDGRPAMEAIIGLCQKAGLHGVSVLRGIEGLGERGVHSASFLSLSSSLPILVEAMDSSEKIDKALRTLRPHLKNRLVATWPVTLIRDHED